MTLEMGKVPRELVDLSHLVFSAGKIGRLKTLSSSIVLPGDSIELNTIGSFRLSPLRRGLAVDTQLEFFTFYVPFRHIYGDTWVDFIKLGISGGDLTSQDIGHDGADWATSFLAQIPSGTTSTLPSFYHVAYKQIYNNFFKVPWDADNDKPLADLSDDTCQYGYPAAHLKNIWSAPVNPDMPFEYAQAVNEDGNLDIVQLQSAYADLQTKQERALFEVRYRDIISGMGGNVNFDADNRPKLLMRNSSWASGYDVDGTDQSSMGQFSGRVQQSFQHQVPRFYCPEHGIVMTLVLARFPPIACWEADYLATQPSLNYYDIGGDPDLLANHGPVRTINMSEVFYRPDGEASFNIPYGQWLRYQRSHVDFAYKDLEGFPFISDAPTIPDGNILSAIYVNSGDYDKCFQTMQLGHFNIQCRFNVNVYRRIPTARTSLMTSS